MVRPANVRGRTMMDRYDNFELPLDERAGYQFIQLALRLVPLLAKGHHAKNTHIKTNLKNLEEALRKVGDIWVAGAKEQPKFSISEGRKKDYAHANFQYSYIKSNKDDFIKREINKQEELRVIANELTEEINNKKIELARAEDEYRHQVQAAKAKGKSVKKGCFQFRKKKVHESSLTAEEIQQRGSADIRRKRKYLTMLRNYHWYVKNQVDQPLDNYQDQHNKWKREIESYDLNMKINDRYLKHAIYRHFANEPENVMCKLFYIYYLIKEVDAVLINKNPELQKLIDELATVADVIYLPKAADRTIESFYKYLVLHYEPETRARLMQIVNDEARLPEVFLASFENSNSPLNKLLLNKGSSNQLQILSGTADETEGHRYG